ncbi:MAG: hypothetical protein WBN09_14035 [Woeseiaceae bacterium]
MASLKIRLSVITCVALLLCVGCGRMHAGPAQLLIETNSEAYPDYVIQSGEKFSTLHGGYADINPWVVVNSNEFLEIPLSEDQPDNLSGFSVTGIHPAFGKTWTAVSLPPLGGTFSLPSMTPIHWSEHLSENEIVDYTTINTHFEEVLTIWVPTIGAEAGFRLSSYMPLLQRLVGSAGWTAKAESWYENEDEARAEMNANFEALQRLAE